MKLSELSDSDFVKMLVYGQSGTGKTCLAGTFPTPTEIWDFDGKANSILKHNNGNKELLESIDVIQFSKMNPATKISAFKKRMDEIFTLHNNKKPLPFKTLIVDSLTTLTAAILDDYIKVSQTALKRPLDGINCMQDYQLLDKHMTQIITTLLALDCNVLFIGHLTTEKDDVTGAIQRKPLMSGKFADKISIWFEEVYVSMVDSQGKFVLQTQTDSTYQCRSQRKLTKYIQTDYKNIINNK